MPGFEPRLLDSKSKVLTNYTTRPVIKLVVVVVVVVVVGFEPTKHIVRDLESRPFDRSGILPKSTSYGTRTRNLPIRSRMRYPIAPMRQIAYLLNKTDTRGGI